MNNKSPSVSGFSKEFFLFFWPDLGDIVVEYVNEAKEKGVFFPTQRRGVITLIPKKGDQLPGRGRGVRTAVPSLTKTSLSKLGRTGPCVCADRVLPDSDRL